MQVCLEKNGFKYESIIIWFSVFYSFSLQSPERFKIEADEFQMSPSLIFVIFQDILGVLTQ